MTQSFKEVFAWQKAHAFVLQVYQVSPTFPSYERFGLCSQFQRAAVSIAANIAEGYRRNGMNDKLHFLNMAQGSLEECRYYVLLSKDLGYINEENYDLLFDAVEETSKLLNGYCKGIIDNIGDSNS